MSRYIDADLIEYEPMCRAMGNGMYEDCETVDKDQIGDIPTADVVEMNKVNKIYEKLADLLGIPCNYSPCDEIMLESERCWEDCGDISDAECWRRYFEVVCDGEREEE